MQNNVSVLDAKNQENITQVTSIKFTKFVDADKKTAKVFDVVDGKLHKSTNGSFWNGSFETINIPFNEIPEFIKSMESGEFIVQGVHSTVVFGSCPDDATRAKALFPFTNEAGLLCIDSDSIQKFNGINTLDDLINVFHSIEPALKPALKFCSSSASSYIEFKGMNFGLRGVHTFIPIDKASAIPEVLECLHMRSIIAGYAYPHITKDGKIVIRSLIDMALKTSNQPIFEGGAILKKPDIKQDRQFNHVEGGLLKCSTITALSIEEQEAYKAQVKLLTKSVLHEAEDKRKEYLSEKSEKMKVVEPDFSEKNARYLIEESMNNILYGQITIRLETGEVVSVQTILDNSKHYHEKACYHPLDDKICGKSIIYSDQDQPVIHTFANGGGVFLLKKTLAEWEIDLNRHVEFFNQTHAQVLIGGKHKIMRTVPADVHYDNRESYEFISLDQLKLLYTNQLIQISEKKCEPVLKDKVTAWIMHKDSKCYEGGVVFAPARELPSDFYNTWQGFAVEPIAGADTSPLKKHIENIICANNQELIKYLYNWIAFTMQYPDKPAGAALVLCGEKGVGKGIFGHFLCNIWGPHATHMSQSRHLIGNFNGHLADKCFIFADEAFFSGDKKSEGVLKALITERTIMIERKGLDAVQQPNYLKIIMATNSEYAVPASKDERRYCVMNVSNARIGDTQYFRVLQKVCSDEKIKSAFLYEMLHRDISEFSPSAIPESVGLKDQRLYSLDSAGKWLVDSFTAGSFSVESDISSNDWQNEMSSKDLYESYLRWTAANKTCHYDIVNQYMLGRYLAKVFSSMRLKNGARGFAFGSLSDAITRFEKYEKVDLELIEKTPVIEWFGGLDEELFSPSMISTANTALTSYSLN